jgi:hypothetical protein
MRFIMLVKADEMFEAGVMPGKELLRALHDYNQSLVRAGVLLAADDLHPSCRGARIVYESGKRTVVDGPFTESKELIAGYWLIQVKSREEAIEWASRVPSGGDGEAVELRQVIELTHLPDAAVPAL